MGQFVGEKEKSALGSRNTEKDPRDMFQSSINQLKKMLPSTQNVTLNFLRPRADLAKRRERRSRLR